MKIKFRLSRPAYEVSAPILGYLLFLLLLVLSGLIFLSYRTLVPYHSLHEMQEITSNNDYLLQYSLSAIAIGLFSMICAYLGMIRSRKQAEKMLKNIENFSRELPSDIPQKKLRHMHPLYKSILEFEEWKHDEEKIRERKLWNIKEQIEVLSFPPNDEELLKILESLERDF